MVQRLSDRELERAIEALAEPGRFREAEARVAQVVPQLERLLAKVVEEGGWFGPVRESELAKAALSSDPDERLRRMRELLQAEARIAMMVGVAVGFELQRELEAGRSGGSAGPGRAGDRASQEDDRGG